MTANPFATLLRKAVDDGYREWAGKPHNEKWVRKIDGTPIPNDLVVCIQGAVSRAALAVATSEAKLAQSEADKNGLVELVIATHENNEALRATLAVAVEALEGVMTLLDAGALYEPQAYACPPRCLQKEPRKSIS